MSPASRVLAALEEPAHSRVFEDVLRESPASPFRIAEQVAVTMIFKFFKQDKTDAEPMPPQATADGGQSPVGEHAAASTSATDATAMPAKVTPPALPPLTLTVAASQLRRPVDDASWGGLGSGAREPLALAAAHEAALVDLDVAVAADVGGFFVLLPPDSLLGPALAAHLEIAPLGLPPAPDWAYVVEPAFPRRLRALPLPRGRAPEFTDNFEAAIDELRATIPLVLSTPEHDLRRRTVAEEVRQAGARRSEEFRQRAKAQNVTVLSTPSGFVLAPIHDGKAVRTEVFALLPPPMRREVETRVGALEQELAAILAENAGAERDRHRNLVELDRETIAPRVSAAFAGLRKAFSDVDDALDYVGGVERGILRDPDVLSVPRHFTPSLVVTAADRAISHPVVAAAPLSARGLLGTAAGTTVMPGHLHAAYGGLLLVDGRELMADACGRSALVQALRTRLFAPVLDVHVDDAVNAHAAQSLEAIPLAARLVVAGDRDTLLALRRAEPGFDTLFPAVCDLSRPITRNSETEAEAARLIAGWMGQDAPAPLDAGALARLVEECARLSTESGGLVVGAGRVRQLAREAGARARRAGLDLATREHVAEAVVRFAMHGRADGTGLSWPESTGRGVVTVASSARPAVVTASVSRGSGRPEDIVRYWPGLAEPDCSRSALLWCLLADRRVSSQFVSPKVVLASDHALAVSDPATAAAEACAMLLALASSSVVHSTAVIGDIGADGRLRDVSDINERIENLHAAVGSARDAAKMAVVVPRASLPRLMLAENVVESVAGGTFTIHAATHVDEVLSLLTGEISGTADASGRFPSDTLNGRIAARLAALSEVSTADTPAPPHVNGAAAP